MREALAPDVGGPVPDDVRRVAAEHGLGAFVEGPALYGIFQVVRGILLIRKADA